MPKMGQRIAQKRKELGLTQEELAHKVGYKSKTTINKIEKGTNDIPSKKLKDFAKALNTTEEYIGGWDKNEYPASNIFPIEKKIFPMLGNIACGEPIYVDQERGVCVNANADIHADFCLRCVGDSMIGDDIKDGDIVFIRKQPLVENGEVACVIIDDEATLKHFYQTDRQVTLTGSNPRFIPLVFSEADCKKIIILGKAVAFTRII